MRDAKEIGVYKLGMSNVRLCVEKGNDGVAAGFYFAPHDGGTPIMMLCGLDVSWPTCVGSILHEAMESLFHKRGVGYVQTQDIEVSSQYLFVMTHNDFDQCCRYASEFMVDCIGDLMKEWEAVNHPVAKKSRKKRK